MAEGKRLYFWNREYTHKQLMKESRWLLIFVAVVHLGLGVYLFLQAGTSEDAIFEGIGIGFFGVVYAIAGLVPSYWFRLVCICIWVLDLLFTVTVLQTPKAPSIIFMVLGASFIYKMIKYRGVQEENISGKAT